MKAWHFALIGVGIVVLLNGKKIVSVIRGIRNKNAGNLVISNNNWIGKVPKELNTDGKFEQFVDTKGVNGHIWGLRALLMDIRGDMFKDGLNTVRKLITSYAPEIGSDGNKENDTLAYINSVSKKIGKKPDDLLTQADLIPVAKAIVAHENSNYAYDDSYYTKAMQLIS